MRKRPSKTFKHTHRDDSIQKDAQDVTDENSNSSHFLMAKKSLGQNFLKNTTIIRRIAEAGEIRMGEAIIEIGPGTGELTAGILAQIDIVIAQNKDNKANNPYLVVIEKDSRAIPILENRFSDHIQRGLLHIIEGDYLEMEPETIILNAFEVLQDKKTAKHNLPTYKIIANIPYYITGAIIRKSLEERVKPEKLIFLVQKEVAERIVTRDGKESILSNSVKAYGDPSILCTVSKGNFVPAPKVDSAVIIIDHISGRKFEDHNISERSFFDIIHAGFGHKRKKTVSNLTDTGLDKQTIEHIFTELGLDHNIRSEEIDTPTWFSIATKISSINK